MILEFKHSPLPTLGVEIEAQLLDPKTLDLLPGAVPLLEAGAGVEDLRMTCEFSQSMVEVKTEICDSVGQVGHSLQRQLSLLRGLARDHGMEIAVSGTHPFHNWWQGKIYPSERYLHILEKFQWLARRLSIFGLHVHVGVRDGEQAIAIINSMINYIPHLLALSSSSPFWAGQNTGLASSRVGIIESFPMGGLPYFMVSWKEFQFYFETLHSNGMIKSIKDIYWDIRPHYDLGTIEVRICDGVPTLQETLALVSLIQCLVVWLDEEYQKGRKSRHIHMQRYWLAPENKWQAARYGLEGKYVNPETFQMRPLRQEIEQLVQTLTPISESLGCAQELKDVLRVLHHGPSSTRQRHIFSRTGSLTDVVKSLADELKSNRPIV